MAEIAISQTWLNSLTRYLNRLQTEAVQRAEGAAGFFQDQVRDKARETPGWEAMADEISVWSQDGKLHIGVSNKDLATEAWMLEYGDENHAPNALFRTLTDQVGLTNEHACTQATAKYGAMNVNVSPS